MNLNEASKLIARLKADQDNTQDTDQRLKVWRSLIDWIHWQNQQEDWLSAFENLPINHKIRECYSSLLWQTGAFADVLPKEARLNGWPGKLRKCFSAFIDGSLIDAGCPPPNPHRKRALQLTSGRIAGRNLS